MKKIFSLMVAASVVATTTFSHAGIIITEIVDGNRIASDGTAGSSPDPFLAFVELTNTGTTVEDLSGFSILNFNNGNNTAGFSSAGLSGSLQPGETFYFAYESAPDPAVPAEFSAFEAVYGFAPNQFAGGKFVNGDDTIILFDTPYPGGDAAVDPASIADIYGVLGTDGSGEDWEYLDSSAIRNPSVSSTTASGFNPLEWTFNPVNSLDGDGAAEHIAQTTVSPPFQTIPEPSSIALLGLVGLAGVVRRRK